LLAAALSEGGGRREGGGEEEGKREKEMEGERERWKERVRVQVGRTNRRGGEEGEDTMVYLPKLLSEMI